MLIRAITKNANGYKIYFEIGKILILTSYEDSYQGISHWGNYWGINDLDIEAGDILGEQIINYCDLPPIIQAHVERVLAESGSG